MAINVGDIYFVGFYANGTTSGTTNTEGFAFLAKNAIAAGEVISFTDGALQANGTSFATNEQLITYTVPAGGIPAGTVVQVQLPDSTSTTKNVYFNDGVGGRIAAGTASDSGNQGLSNSGDEIFAFQGTQSSAIVLAGISSVTPITSGATTTNNSYAPTNGAPFVVSSGNLNFVYGSDPRTATPAQLMAVSNFSTKANSTDPNATFNALTPSTTLSISDASIAEGNSGTSVLTFTVTASAPAASGGIGFTINTADGTATAGSDYVALTNATGLIAAGQTTGTVSVIIDGDTTYEADETFTATLSNVTNATIARAAATGTILNDDTAPTVSVSDPSVTEGNSGTTALNFVVTLSAASGVPTSVNYATSDGTANAPSDYAATSGTLTFSPGVTSQTVAVSVNGDTTVEPDETVILTLSAPNNATIAKAQGTGTILNDDTAAPTMPMLDISQVYGGGGNAGSTYKNDFIELYNYGTTTVDLTGYSVQYAAATGTSWQVTSLSGSVAAGHYYLVQESAGTGGTTALPTPDAIGAISISSTAGKVALSSSTTAFSGATPTGASLVDFVGFGTANSYEGSGAAPAPSNTTADIRTPSNQDTNNNAADFTVGPANPRNSTVGGTSGSTVSVGNASVVEGNSGTAALTFTITRTDATSAFTVHYATADGTATTSDNDYVAASGDLTFAANGSLSQTVSVTVNGDTKVEPNETLTLNLTNLVNASGTTSIATASGTGTIRNDDFTLTPIYTIQGSGLASPLAGSQLTTSGIVTALATNGYYLQDQTGDANTATSDAIFVFTSTNPAGVVAVGDLVDVSGTVQEYKASSARGALSVTELSAITNTVVISSNNAVPAAVIIGPDGVSPPTTDLAAGTAFYESLEGMRVTLESPVSVGPTNQYGEIFTVVNNGVGATGLNSRGDLLETTGTTPRFGYTDYGSNDGDFNPERIKIDGGLVSGAVPSVNTGTHFGNVTGILNYAFDNFGVSATAPVTVTQASTLTPTVGTLAADATHLTFGSYNIENFSSTANIAGQGPAKVQAVAMQILTNLNAPDVVALQEVQDNSGPTDDGTISAGTNLQNLVAAINAKGGAQYAFLDNPFIGNDTNGGQPGGNIRTAFLYRTDVPGLSFVQGSLATIGANGAAITTGPDSSQQTDPNNPFYDSRPPLSAQFVFNGQLVTIVDNHFTSKGGSGDLEGTEQPAFDGGEVQRAGQAQAVNTYVDSLLASNPAVRVIVTGDLNEFTGEEPLDVLEGTATISGYSVPGTDPIMATATYTAGGAAVLTDLESTLPADQQFDYNFQGNAESLVHTLVTNALLPSAQFQPIHINADFANQISDHDALLASFAIPQLTVSKPVLSAASDSGSSNTDGITNVTTPTVTGTATPGATVTLYDTDGTTVLGTMMASVTDGSYMITATALAEGPHSLTTVASENGASSARSATLQLTIDTSSPQVAFTSLGGVVNQATQVVNGIVDVADAGSTVSIFEDGATTAVATAVVAANGHWSTSVALGATGTHTLLASDTDVAGNTGTTAASLIYNLDTTKPVFTTGNLVISISGNGDGSGSYGDNQATPLVLQEITTAGAYVGQIVLPQATTTVNGKTQSAFSAEYGSSSEGILQRSADEHSLVIAGYGINAQTYNAGGAAVYGDARLAQSTSVPGGAYPAVPRVIADVNANGTVDTSTALYNVDNTNNPRSVATVDGTSFYLSGQGKKGDTTQGLFYVADGASTPTAIDQSTDTRVATIYNGQLYVSRDSTQGTGGTDNIAVYGTSLPTAATVPTILTGINKSVILTAQTANTVNGAFVGSSVNLDPEQFFFANATTLYVADGGVPKQGAAASSGAAGDGGLQKWTFNGGAWTLQYTLSQGLGLVSGGNAATAGTTGLIGLAGQVVGNSVELYATNQTAGDLDQKYVFAITDQLNGTTGAGESFTTIATAAPDTNIRGIAFAPLPANNAPAGADARISVRENGAYTFAAADFGFSDPMDSPSNSLLAVKIATLPTTASGMLFDNGAAITAGQFISASDLAAGQFVFRPTAGATGMPEASFTFQVQDNGGTSSGGIDTDPTPNTITVDVRRNDVSHDLNADARSDILFRNASTGDFGYLTTDATGARGSYVALGGSNTSYIIAGVGDLTGAGHADVLFRAASGDFGYVDPTTDTYRSLGGSNASYAVGGVGDLNGDGIDEIFFRNASTGDMGYFAAGGTSPGYNSLGGSNTAYGVAGVADFTGAGHADVLFRNAGTGDLGYFDPTDRSYHGLGGSNASFSVAGVGDFDAAGHADILFRNSSTGDLGYLDPTGANAGYHALGGSAASYGVASVGDYNGDGVADILFRNASTGDMGYLTTNAGARGIYTALGTSNASYGVS